MVVGGYGVFNSNKGVVGNPANNIYIRFMIKYILKLNLKNSINNIFNHKLNIYFLIRF